MKRLVQVTAQAVIEVESEDEVEEVEGIKDEHYDLLYVDKVVKNLEEILRKNKMEKAKKRLRNEYIVVKQSDFKDDGDTFEAIKDGYGLPPIGCKYVKVK